MSNYKQLKSNPEYNISLVDIMSFVTKTNKAKYLDLFCKLYKNKKNATFKTYHYDEALSTNFNIPKSEVDTLTSFSAYIHYLITENMSEDIKLFQKFVTLNERGLIEKNDVLTYSSIDELKNEVSKSESRHIEKEMEKQVQKISDDEEWLVLRPLTYESSKKYGSNTKWCTTHNERTYFDKYTKNGILIYMINKKTGVKVAMFKSTKHNDEPGLLGGIGKEFSFWDQKDLRIDSMESGLPDYVKSILMEEIKNNPLSNLELYAKRNKIQVPTEKEYFKKGVVITEPDGVLPNIDQGRTRIRRLLNIIQQQEEIPQNRGEVGVERLVEAIRNHHELVNQLENERIDESNEEIEENFVNQIREIEDADTDFINEMESRVDDDYELRPVARLTEEVPVGYETEDEEIDEEIGEEDSDEVFLDFPQEYVNEMTERLGNYNFNTFSVTIQRPGTDGDNGPVSA